jgi:phosphate starvation-inducible PhoH-like protein
MNKPAQRDFVLEPEDNERLANLAGPFDEHLRQLELRLGVEIANRGHVFRVTGEAKAADAAEKVLRSLYAEAGHEVLDPHKIHTRLGAANLERLGDGFEPQEVAIRVKRGTVRGRGANQSTTSTSASARPARARPSSPLRWPWKR